MKQGVELSQGQRYSEMDENVQAPNKNGLRILEIWAEGFLEDSFNTIYSNIEYFTIGNFKESSLFFAMEGLVCQTLYKAESPSLGFKRLVETQKGENPKFVIDAENTLREIFSKTIDDILDLKLSEATSKKQIPNTVLAGVVCKDMCTAACNNIFNLEKEKMAEDYSKQQTELKKEQEFKAEQDKVIEIFKNISKSNSKVPDFGLPDGYNPRFMSKSNEHDLTF